jgi:pyoverdine/dityrosine biosynthesis protein Dit1
MDKSIKQIEKKTIECNLNINFVQWLHAMYLRMSIHYHYTIGKRVGCGSFYHGFTQKYFSRKNMLS